MLQVDGKQKQYSKCKHCNKEIAGYARERKYYHSMNCSATPIAVKRKLLEFYNYTQGGQSSSKAAQPDLLGQAESPQKGKQAARSPSSDHRIPKDEKEELDVLLGDWIYGLGVPFHIVEQPLFKEWVARLQLQPGYRLPRGKQIAGVPRSP